MKKYLAIFLVFALTPSVFAQHHHGGGRMRSDGFYVSLGATSGPSFSDFFDYINETYNPPSNFKEFGSNVSVSVGYITRFHRNFGLDVGFSIYDLKSKGDYPNRNSAIPESRISHELDYQAAIFTGTLPILFEFAPRQPVVPYVGMGISIFSMRLDDFRNGDVMRDTRTAVGGHFEAGAGIKITPRLWLDARGRWHNGSGHLATLEPGLRDFSIKQNISQYSLGIDYFFR